MNASILTVIITGVFSVLATLYVTQLGRDDSNVISQRQSWREDIRKWIKSFTNEVEKFSSNLYSELESRKSGYISIAELRNYLHLRINPHRDNEIIELVDNLILKLTKNATKEDSGFEDEIKNTIDNDLKTITRLLSILLKHDWDRVKNNNTILGNFIILNILILIASSFSVIQVINRFSVFNNYEFALIVLVVLILLKLILKELNKCRLFREKVFYNLFEDKERDLLKSIFSFCYRPKK